MLRPAYALLALLAIVLLPALGLAQVTLKKGAVVYTGSAANTSAPATIDEARVREATPEWKKMQNEGIDPDSAQGKQLVVQMNDRIREAAKSVAAAEGADLVTRRDDIQDRQGREVADLTDKVAKKVAE